MYSGETKDQTIFETTLIAPDDPLLARSLSSLSLDLLVEAARIVTAYPDEPAIQQFRRHVVTLRLTPDEFEELLNARARLRAAEIVRAPMAWHES